MTLDARTLDSLYRSHGPMVLRRARSLLGDVNEAQDAAQEIFASLVHRPEQFHGHSAPSTFLYAMTTNHCLRRIRDRKNRARLIELHVVPRSSDSSAPVGEKRAVLLDFLQRVPTELAEVAVYFYLDEMSYDEIAGLLSCSRRHVADLLVRFRDKARQLSLPKDVEAA